MNNLVQNTATNKKDTNSKWPRMDDVQGFWIRLFRLTYTSINNSLENYLQNKTVFRGGGKEDLGV